MSETAVCICFLVSALIMSGLADRSAIVKECLFTLFDRALQWSVFLSLLVCNVCHRSYTVIAVVIIPILFQCINPIWPGPNFAQIPFPNLLFWANPSPSSEIYSPSA